MLASAAPLTVAEPHGSWQAALLCSAPESPAPGWGPGWGRRGGQAVSGAVAVWICSSNTFAGWSGLRLAMPTGSRLLGAGQGQGSLLATRLSSLSGSLKAALVPRHQAWLMSTSMDHGAFYWGEKPPSLARCSADSRPPRAAARPGSVFAGRWRLLRKPAQKG